MIFSDRNTWTWIKVQETTSWKAVNEQTFAQAGAPVKAPRGSDLTACPAAPGAPAESQGCSTWAQAPTDGAQQAGTTGALFCNLATSCPAWHTGVFSPCQTAAQERDLTYPWSLTHTHADSRAPWPENVNFSSPLSGFLLASRGLVTHPTPLVVCTLRTSIYICSLVGTPLPTQQFPLGG